MRLQPTNVEPFDKLRAGSLTLNVLVWAEGADKPKGKSRFDLHPADEFVIYTTPPSPVELRQALEIVKPKVIYIFAVPPAEEKPDNFINRLAGLCKYAINQRGGKATVHELAAAMASRESAIEIGLQWLAAGGHLSATVDEDEVILSAENTEGNPYLQKELYTALKGILNETAAYRRYFSLAQEIDLPLTPVSKLLRDCFLTHWQDPKGVSSQSSGDFGVRKFYLRVIPK